MIRLDESFLRGSYPPLVTPFRNGAVDLGKFAALVDRQVREGSHGVLINGTTAEPSSLTIAERNDLLKVAVETVAGRVPVVAATGSQSYAETVALTRFADQAGADALLVVTPYYIKPSQQGLVEYFSAIGRETRLPLMIYHIPGRAAVSVTGATVQKIADKTPTLVGMKHASMDLELVTELLSKVGAGFRIFCGLESASLPMLAIGACGLMNAVGNLAPATVAALYNAAAAGNLAEARRLHLQLFELNQSIFLDTNPIPLKYMLTRLGLLDSPELRLPLVPLDAERGKILDDVLSRAGLLEYHIAGQ
ncbi:MAG TPA: 4-hydroxy-tetrahydrodipicolinate synthase [Bryobacteraceae bacterium]|nr:4-hydroxy-tetrahydrodipicolinate synthase [Bryobacteraceae bacterium]